MANLANDTIRTYVILDIKRKKLEDILNKGELDAGTQQSILEHLGFNYQMDDGPVTWTKDGVAQELERLRQDAEELEVAARRSDEIVDDPMATAADIFLAHLASTMMVHMSDQIKRRTNALHEAVNQLKERGEL